MAAEIANALKLFGLPADLFNKSNNAWEIIEKSYKQKIIEYYPNPLDKETYASQKREGFLAVSKAYNILSDHHNKGLNELMQIVLIPHLNLNSENKKEYKIDLSSTKKYLENYNAKLFTNLKETGREASDKIEDMLSKILEIENVNSSEDQSKLFYVKSKENNSSENETGYEIITQDKTIFNLVKCFLETITEHEIALFKAIIKNYSFLSFLPQQKASLSIINKAFLNPGYSSFKIKRSALDIGKTVANFLPLAHHNKPPIDKIPFNPKHNGSEITIPTPTAVDEGNNQKAISNELISNIFAKVTLNGFNSTDKISTKNLVEKEKNLEYINKNIPPLHVNSSQKDETKEIVDNWGKKLSEIPKISEPNSNSFHLDDFFSEEGAKKIIVEEKINQTEVNNIVEKENNGTSKLDDNSFQLASPDPDEGVKIKVEKNDAEEIIDNLDKNLSETQKKLEPNSTSFHLDDFFSEESAKVVIVEEKINQTEVNNIVEKENNGTPKLDDNSFQLASPDPDEVVKIKVEKNNAEEIIDNLDKNLSETQKKLEPNSTSFHLDDFFSEESAKVVIVEEKINQTEVNNIVEKENNGTPKLDDNSFQLASPDPDEVVKIKVEKNNAEEIIDNLDKNLSETQKKLEPNSNSFQLDDFFNQEEEKEAIVDEKTSNNEVNNNLGINKFENKSKGPKEIDIDPNPNNKINEDKDDFDLIKPQVIQNLLKVCEDYIQHLEKEIRKKYSQEKYPNILEIKTSGNKNEVLLKQYAVIDLLISDLKEPNKKNEDKFFSFKVNFQMRKPVITQRTDSWTETFLKLVATIITLGAVAVFGIWKNKPACKFADDVAKKVEVASTP